MMTYTHASMPKHRPQSRSPQASPVVQSPTTATTPKGGLSNGPSSNHHTGGVASWLRSLLRPKVLIVVVVVYTFLFFVSHHSKTMSLVGVSPNSNKGRIRRGGPNAQGSPVGKGPGGKSDSTNQLKESIQEMYREELGHRKYADQNMGLDPEFDPSTSAPAKSWSLPTKTHDHDKEDAKLQGGSVVGGAGGQEDGEAIKFDATKGPHSVAILSLVRDDTFPHDQLKAFQQQKSIFGVVPLFIAILHEHFPTKKAEQLVTMYAKDESVRIVTVEKRSDLMADVYNDVVEHHVPAGCEYLFFIHEHLFPLRSSVDGLSFLDSMIRHFHQRIPEQRSFSQTDLVHKIGLIGCTTVAQGTNETIIVDRGAELGLGMKGSTSRHHFMVRRHIGLNEKDARVLKMDPVDFISPYCLMTPRTLYKALNGFIQLDPAVSGVSIERLDAVVGSPSVELTKVGNIVFNILAFRTQFLDRAISKIKISEVSAGSKDFRKRVMKAISVDTAAIQMVEARLGITWTASASVHVKLPDSILAKERRHIKSFLERDRQAMLMSLKEHVEEAMALAQDFGKVPAVLPPEETLGWDFAIRARRLGFGAFVSNATMSLHSVVASNDQIADLVSKGEMYPASYMIDGGFLKTWKGDLPKFHKANRHSKDLSTSTRLRVMWYAYCCNCCGFVNEIVSLVAHLQKLQMVDLIPEPSCFCPLSVGNQDMVQRLYANSQRLTKALTPAQRTDISVWISHTDPSMYNDMNIRGVQNVEYFIGRSMYEFSRISPDHVAEANKRADEVWVPAQFVKNVYLSSGVEESKLVVIPEAVDVHHFNPENIEKIQLPPTKWHHWCNREPEKNSYTFFSDFKWEPRKGWDILFESYFSAFKAESRSTTLYLLTHVWFSGGPETYGDKHNITHIRLELNAAMEAAKARYDSQHAHNPKKEPFPFSMKESERPTYCIVSHSLSPKSLGEFYNSIDAFVLPTRGEGWGLPTIQAMSMGKPTISTNWGGNTEFMTAKNSFLIPLDGVVEVPHDSVYGAALGKKWAQPSVKGLMKILRYLPKHREYAKKIGRRARKHVVENFSEESLGVQIDKQLEIVRTKVLQRRAAQAASDVEKKEKAKKAKEDEKRKVRQQQLEKGGDQDAKKDSPTEATGAK